MASKITKHHLFKRINVTAYVFLKLTWSYILIRLLEYKIINSLKIEINQTSLPRPHEIN